MRIKENEQLRKAGELPPDRGRGRSLCPVARIPASVRKERTPDGRLHATLVLAAVPTCPCSVLEAHGLRSAGVPLPPTQPSRSPLPALRTRKVRRGGTGSHRPLAMKGSRTSPQDPPEPQVHESHARFALCSATKCPPEPTRHGHSSGQFERHLPSN